MAGSGRSDDRRVAGRSDGFTMIEILVVLSIIAIIMALISPTLFRLAGRGDVTKARALIVQVSTALKAYAADPKCGAYPPTSLENTFLKLPSGGKYKPNETNIGIESLVFHLLQGDYAGESPFSDDKHFSNTDDDRCGVTLPGLNTDELLEYTDAWGNPLIYINLLDLDAKAGTRYQVALRDGEILVIEPFKSRRFKGAWAGWQDGFQLISLGPDEEFDTADDIVSWNPSGSKDDEGDEESTGP
jgi:prepilin-type N-terminal cleavage/methylation domain-containing protein